MSRPLDRESLTWFVPHYLKDGEGVASSAAIREGQFKQIRFFEGGRALYDLERDIGGSGKPCQQPGPNFQTGWRSN